MDGHYLSPAIEIVPVEISMNNRQRFNRRRGESKDEFEKVHDDVIGCTPKHFVLTLILMLITGEILYYYVVLIVFSGFNLEPVAGIPVRVK